MAEKKGRGKIASLVEEIIKTPVEEAGYLLWDVDYYKEGADFNLLVTIENPDGQKPIDLDDCEKVSRLLSPILDEKDPIAEAYYLEVSSAGLERELIRPEHFSYYLGSLVEIRLFAPVGGKKVFRGILARRDGEQTELQTQEGSLTFENDRVAKVTTVDESL